MKYHRIIVMSRATEEKKNYNDNTNEHTHSQHVYNKTMQNLPDQKKQNRTESPKHSINFLNKRTVTEWIAM